MDVPRKRRRTTRDTAAILVALSAGAQTGAEIQSQIVGDTSGLCVSTGTLYTSLHRLVEMGLLDTHDKLYSLTDVGWRTLDLEIRTLESLVKVAKKRIIASGHGHW